jgi:hypothetical protein
LRVEYNDTATLRVIRSRVRAVEGHAAAQRGNMAEARRLLEPTLPHVGSAVNGAVRWWLGEVLLALGEDDEALRYDDSLRGWDSDRDEFTLRHDRSARIHERNGRREEAKASLRELLLIWKDADPGHPAVADARARLERL